VTIECVASIFDDDVGVSLEDRDQLLVRWHGFIEHDATMGLRHHPSSNRKVVLQQIEQPEDHRIRELLRRVFCGERRDDMLRRDQRLVCDLQ
jgi:hypothetical protein